jgi:hypothetical protein
VLEEETEVEVLEVEVELDVLDVLVDREVEVLVEVSVTTEMLVVELPVAEGWGAMMLNEIVAPHCASGMPSGQHPAFVQ